MKSRIRGTTPELEREARRMRREPTNAEMVLWNFLRGGRMRGHHFRQQHPVGQFVFDFCCMKQRLVIEVDGGYHDEAEQRERDIARDQFLVAGGFKVLRFRNEDVENELQWVLSTIDHALP